MNHTFNISFFVLSSLTLRKTLPPIIFGLCRKLERLKMTQLFCFLNSSIFYIFADWNEGNLGFDICINLSISICFLPNSLHCYIDVSKDFFESPERTDWIEKNWMFYIRVRFFFGQLSFFCQPKIHQVLVILLTIQLNKYFHLEFVNDNNIRSRRNGSLHSFKGLSSSDDWNYLCLCIFERLYAFSLAM